MIAILTSIGFGIFISASRGSYVDVLAASLGITLVFIWDFRSSFRFAFNQNPASNAAGKMGRVFGAGLIVLTLMASAIAIQSAAYFLTGLLIR